MTARGPISDRLLPSWGGPLTENDYATLARSWITEEIADEAMLRRVDAEEGREIVGQKRNRDCSGILFGYYWPGEPRPHSYRIRRDNPDYRFDSDGKPKPDRKYLGPPKSANRLYIPPGVTVDQLQDTAMSIVFVEGEKKALALQRLAYHESERPRFIPIAIPGVWNWRGVVGKTSGVGGQRVDVTGPISDLDRIPWASRQVFLLFDTNVHENESVQKARQGFARMLTGRAAQVDLVDLPPDCGVNGVDDLLAAWGPARVLELFEKAKPSARLEIVQSPQFDASPRGIFRTVEKGDKLSKTQLCNYQAQITANVTLDDGVEASREFEIQATLNGRSFRFTISASDFLRMDWPVERMGAQAITYPHQKDYARTAIQSLSLTAEERIIYTHTGWRQVDGKWLFLHAGGAIGCDGAESGINVRLSAAMSRYELRLPSNPEALTSAVKASLRLVELGPPSISFPLLAATCRAVFGEADFSLHLAGETGEFKSELASLYQRHFGTKMDRLHLPGGWSSTGNALEVLAFQSKDALFVIDDFAPQGSQADVARCHAAADRIFRAAGNHAGRGRLDSTAKLRETKPPRALILSTGEDILILELAKGAIKAEDLTLCQHSAGEGLYAEAMGGFVQSLASRYDERRDTFERMVSEYRAKAFLDAAHARTPEIVANLQAAFEMFLDFGVECGAITVAERHELANRCWAALRDAAAAQSKHQAATEPAGRFLTLLRSLLASGRAHLAARNGGEPEWRPESCGWRRDGGGRIAPLGECVGWLDGEDIYIEPTVAYRLVQLAGRDGGEGLAISEQTLKRRLRGKRFLASTDERRETLTIRKTLGGSSKDVLHLHRHTLLPDEPDSDDQEEE